MKYLSLLTLFVLSVAYSNAQTVNYDILFSETIGLQQTSGDICSAPWTIEEAFQISQGNTWGCTWTSTNTGVALSVDVELAFTVTQGGVTHPTTLNGVSSNNVMDGPQKNCESSTYLTWSIDPTSYNSGGLNTFLTDFAAADSVSQLDNLIFDGDPYMRVVVTYQACSTGIDTTVTAGVNTVTSNATSSTFQWIDCATGVAILGETGATYTASASGDYAVIVSDTISGCSDTSVCTMVTFVGVAENDREFISLYPNPVQDELSISLTDLEGDVVFSVFDLTGKLVLSKDVNVQSGKTIELNVNELATGQYQLAVRSKMKTFATKFIKE